MDYSIHLEKSGSQSSLIWLLTTLADDFLRESEPWLIDAESKGWICGQQQDGCNRPFQGATVPSIATRFAPKKRVAMSMLTITSQVVVSDALVKAIGRNLMEESFHLIPILDARGETITGIFACQGKQQAHLRGNPADDYTMSVCPICKQERTYAGRRLAGYYVRPTELNANGVTGCQGMGIFVTEPIAKAVAHLRTRKGLTMYRVQVHE